MFLPAARLMIAASFILALTACASSRSLDQSITDLSGDAQLKGVLFADRSRDYSDIDITLFEGRLMLTGSMRSADGRIKLIENAWKASGVEQVIDEIFVGDKTPFGQGLNDARIDQTLRARLIANKDITSARYKVSVSSAVVYLIGAARDQQELDKTIAIARTIGGVEKVVSYVQLRLPGDAQ